MPKLGKYTKAWVGGYALTSYLTNAAAGQTHDEYEASGYGQDHNYMAGQASGEITLDGWVHLTAQTALATIAPATTKIVTIAYGNNAAPAIGDVCASMDAQGLNYSATPVLSGIAALNAVFKSGSANDDGVEWGKLLADATVTQDGSQTAVDNGAGTSAGGAGYLHILGTSAGDSIVVKIQDSSDNNTYADLITFTLDGSAIGAERAAVAGNVDQYVKVTVDVTGTGISFPIVVNFVRY